MAFIPLTEYKLGRQNKPKWMSDTAYKSVKQPIKAIPLTLFKAGPVKPQPVKQSVGFPESAKQILKKSWEEVKPGSIDLISKGVKKYQSSVGKYLIPKSPDEAPENWKSIDGSKNSFMSGTTIATRKSDGSFTYVDFGGIGPIKNVGKTAGKGLFSKIASYIKKPTTGFPENKSVISNITSEVDGIPQPDPVKKIIQALKEAKPLEKAQQALYSAERSKRVARIASIGQNIPGESGFQAQLGSLKGELPKVEFEGIRNKVSQTDIDSLFNQVEKANITPFEKISAKTGLANLLGKDGGRVPTKGEIALLSEVFPPEFTQTLLSKRNAWEKFKDTSLETLNIPRSIMASTDLSAPLRQGILMVSKPKQFLPALKGMFKYAVSEKAYLNLVDDIKARPNYLLMRESKLGLTDSISPALSAREEQFMSNFAEKIPGFGKIVKGSNRAYTGFLNKLRADVFDDLVKKSRALGIEQTPKLTRDIAKYINTSTGRGELGALQNSAPLLNAVFFSPRLLASRLNVLNPVYYAKLEPFVRKEALKSLFTFAGIGGTVLALAKLAGAEVGDESTSSDFGKIKVGNTRYDIFGGFQQYIRLASQLMQGKVTSSSSGKTITFGEGYKPLTRKDIILRFFESKESPIASFATSWLQGTNSMGEKFKLPNETLNRLTPIIVQDMYDLYQEGGLEDLIKGLPTPFGVGTQTYGQTELIKGLNPLGEPTSQIRQVPGLTDAVIEKLFGKQPLGSSKSFDVEQYYDQLIKLPKEEAAQIFEDITATNPDLAKQIQTVVSDRQKGITVEDKDLKAKGVASGDRALAIKKQLDKLKTPQEKAELWDEYVAKGIITKDVATQLSKLMD